jgi:cytoskeleton protein RodZ
MPLDTGAVTTGLNLSLGADRADGGIIPAPRMDAAPSVGAALRALREYYGLSIDEVARTTCIRRQYLTLLEDMQLDELPSRPFVIGYIRAYAGVVGLDPAAAVARFRHDDPDGDQTLQAPVGVAHERKSGISPFIVGGVLVVLAVLAWNIAQHAIKTSDPVHPAEIAASSARIPAAAPRGPVTLGSPLPAPAESTIPAPYITPGLEAASKDGSPTSAASAGAVSAESAAAAPPSTPVGSPFEAHGAIYGANASQSTVTLQAKKSVSLIIHGGAGAVYFARQLATGEAYRLPRSEDLSVETSDPEAVEVYVGGLFKGPLPAASLPASKITE